jgi:L-lactate dehydrogenase complex protein LldF
VSGRVLHPPQPEPDPAVRPTLHVAAANWEAGRARAKALVDWEAWRDRAAAIRQDAIAHLPELLDRLEARVTAAGGVVHRAATAADAAEIAVRLAGGRSVVKSKSMLTEELALNAALEAAGASVVETDLGEWILQLRGDRPSHILAPAVHLSAEQVAELFSERAGEAIDAADTSRLVGYARGALRESFLAAEVGITGVNMAVAETGTLVLVESEGNIRMCTALPRVHVAMMGIEKVIRDWAGAAHMVQMLPLAAHGKPAATYTSFITGVDPAGGPQELHLVLVDDGRSSLLGTDLERALDCIRCGACLYVCPVYRQMGGHRYGSAYAGPIGAVLTPALEGSGSEELPWMSSLCGACAEACPVKIPLDQQLVTLRSRASGSRSERAFWAAWAAAWSSPAGYRASARAAGALTPEGWLRRAPFPFSRWTGSRDARGPAAEPFHVRWAKRDRPLP